MDEHRSGASFDAASRRPCEGIVILDAQDRVMDLNPMAQQIIAVEPSETIGRPINQVFAHCAALLSRLNQEGAPSGEIALGQEGNQRRYQLDVYVLRDSSDRPIGRLCVLTGCAQGMTNEPSSAQGEALLGLLELATERCFSATDWEPGIEGLLAQWGQALGVSHVGVFQNQLGEDGNLLISQRYKWVDPNLESPIGNADLGGLSYSTFGRWLEILGQGQPLYDRVENLPGQEQAFLVAQGILSLAVAPIIAGEQWWGFMGLFDCRTRRLWSRLEINTLRATAKLFGTAIYRQRLEKESTTLARLSSRLAAASSVEAMVTAVREESDHLLGWDAHFFAVRSPDQETFHVLSFADTVAGEKCFYEAEIWPESALSAPLQEVLQGRPILINRSRTSSSPALFPWGNKERLSASLIFAPVISGQRVLGVLSIQSYTYGRYQQQDLDLLLRIADMVAPALKRAFAEEALLESEERYRRLVELSPDGIAVLQGDRFVFVNERLARLVGAEGPEQMMGQPALRYLPPELQAWVGQDPGDRNQVEATTVVEGQMPRPDGSVLDIEVAAIRSSDQGHPAIQMLVRDISERKQIEEERRQLLSRIQKIMDNIPDGVVLLDEQWRVVLANRAGWNHLALLADGELGDRLTQLDGRPMEALLQPPPSGVPYHELVVEGAHQRVFEVVSQPLSGEGWLMILRDVSDEHEMRRRAESQDRLAVMGQLAAGIAHDFNNILQAILGFTGLLQRRPDLPAKARRQLDYIETQGRRGAQLVQQILDFSRQSVSRQHPVDLLIVLRDATNLLHHTIPENIDLRLQFQAEDYWVKADVSQIQQVLTNLVLNARDAMPEGGLIQISLSRLAADAGVPFPAHGVEPGEWVVIQVEDTGTGIPTHVLPYILEPFFTTKEPGKGTGMGLAQVQGIVSAHGGFINVETQPGKGTLFSIYLPAVPPPVQEQLPTPCQGTHCGDGETLLIVEDDEAVLEVNRVLLEELGYRVLTSRDGHEALAVFEQHRHEIDLLITDSVMPHMGGLQLLQTLRQQDCWVRTIVLSGYPLDSSWQALQQEGLVTYIQKPISGRQLAQAVQQALEAPLPSIRMRLAGRQA